MEYKVIMKSSIKGLEKEVISDLKQGWKLQGGVCLERFVLRKFYLQALSRENKV